jgi:hypothetical protein
MTEQKNKGKVILMRNGIEFYVSDLIAKDIQKNLKSLDGNHCFLQIGNRQINTADLVGIFEFEDLETRNMTK